MQPRQKRTGNRRTLTLRCPAVCGESLPITSAVQLTGGGLLPSYVAGAAISFLASLSCRKRKRAAGLATRAMPT